MANGPDRNCNCRRLGGQNLHPYKRPIGYFAPDLTIIQESIKRKNVRGPGSRAVITEDPFYPSGQDKFVPTPNTTVIRVPLSSSTDIYNAGLYPSGSSVNLGIFQTANGIEDGNSYRVNANNQGLFIRNPMRAMPLDIGEFSVYLNGHDAGGSGTNNYILDVGQNMVFRWESGSQELRLYPDLANYPSDYIGLPLTSAQWYSAPLTWHKYKIKWSYEDQDWQLFIDDTEGKRTGSSTIPYPGWTALIQVSIFADQNNENNVYHDAQFINFGEFAVSSDGGCGDCCYQIDATSGSNSTYGDITGFGVGNLRLWTSLGYMPDSLRVWRNTDELTKGVDFNETNPFSGQFNLTSVIIDGESFVSAYVPWGESCPDAKFVVAFASGSGSGTISTGPEPRVDGALNGINKIYTLPYPFVEGKVRMLWQGMNQNQGDGSDWQEVDPYLGTVQFTDALPGWTTIGAVFIPLTRYYEGSNTTLSGTVGSGNTDFETSYRFIPTDIEVKKNGQLLTPNVDFTLPTNKMFRLAEASISGEYYTVAYGILFENGSDAIIARTFDFSDDASNLTTDYRTVAFDTTSGTIGITLPDAYQALTHTFNLKKISRSNSLDISGSGSQTIDGQGVQSIIFANDSMSIEPNAAGTGWIIK